MGFLDRLRETWAIWRPPQGAGVVALREAAGVTIDEDEDQWRRLTGATSRDLTPLTQSRMRELALYLWESNLLANRMVELPLAYILGEGVRLTVPDDDAQGWLDAFWNDPINALDIKLAKKVRELALFGEQCWPAFVHPASGHVRLGYLDPELIETVVTDPDNAEQPIGIVTCKDRKGVSRRYRVIVNGPEEVFSDRTRAIRRTFDTGECFYFKINDLSNGRRGRSDLLAQADWADAYEQFLFGEIDRASFMRAFMWDVTLKGATGDEVKERARTITPPSPGAVRVHNDSEEWRAESPDLKAYQTSEHARLFRNHMLGGGTIPEHWYGGGGDVNRSTGESMGEPTFKVFSMRQRFIGHILEEMGRFVLSRRLDPSGRSSPYFPDPDPQLTPRAEWPEMTARDTTQYAAALQQVVVAVGMAVDRGMMTELLAVRIIHSVAGRLGVECDAERELADARDEAAARAAADVIEELPAGERDAAA